MSELNNIALKIIGKGKGILAADESTGTMTKRLDSVKVESTSENRLLFRETLFRSSNMKDCIGGVILYDETIKQSSSSGEKIPELIEKIKEGYDQVLVTRFGKGSVNLDAGIIDRFGNKMFTFLVNVFFGGHWTDVLNENRIISRKAFNELKFDALGLSSTQQMCIRGLKRKQKICEIIGNEGERIGGTRKMHPLSTGASLSWQIIKEFIFWKT